MKKVFLYGFIVAFCFPFALCFSGCTTPLTVTKDLSVECEAISDTLISTYHNKDAGVELVETDGENFYVEIADDEIQNLTAITMSDRIYRRDLTIKFSVGNNNFLDVPVWKLEDSKLFIALPTLYVEATGGITIIEAGNKIYSIRVFEDGVNLTVDSVGVFGISSGASAEKTVDSFGHIIVKHTRESGQTSVGWVLSQNETVVPGGKYIFTKKFYEDTMTISYGVDVTLDANTTQRTAELYNYYQVGGITTPKNRTIDYTIAIPNIGNVNFEIQITERIPS